MGYLIDGFNLIYKFPHLEGMMYEGKLNDARKGLIDILKDFYRIKKPEIRVIFDGKKNPGDNTPQETLGPIRVYYSHDLSADHLIKEFVKTNPNPPMTTVVTSDKEIIFYVNRFKAPVIKSEDFAPQVQRAIEDFEKGQAPEKDENPTLSEEELGFWERLFNKK